MKNQKFLNVYAVAIAAVLLGGCASTPADKTAQPEAADASASAGVAVSSDPKAPLERRVTDRWKLLIAKDAARAYTYLTPGYRAGTSASDYAVWMGKRQITWLSAAYSDRNCTSEDACKVDLMVQVETSISGIPGRHQTSSLVTEDWLRIDGVWYFLPQDNR